MVGKFDSRRRMDIGHTAAAVVLWHVNEDTTRLTASHGSFSFDSNLFTVSGQEEAILYTRTYANNILLITRRKVISLRRA